MNCLACRWAWQFLRRDAQAGELRVLLAALIVAVASVTAVGFFTDRLHAALELQANELLGGDVALGTSELPPAAWSEAAHQHQLRTAVTLTFPSMVSVNDRHELAAIKAISDTFPLRGSLRVARSLFGVDAIAKRGPEPGTVWLESRLAAALQIDVGNTITLGVSNFQVGGIVTSEPGQATGNVFALAPRVLLNLDDVARTQLITPASRARYQLLVAGEPAAVETWRREVSKQLQPGQRVVGVDEARPEVRTALDRAARFLSLAALTSVLLAGVAIALAVHRYAQRHMDHCAIMRCMGASQSFITRVFIGVIMLVGVIGVTLGTLGGAIAHLVLIETLRAWLDVQLPLPSWEPVLVGVAVGAVTLLGFGLPPLLRLKTVSPLRVLRRDMGWLPPRSIVVYGLGLLAFASLVMWQAADIKLGAMVLGGVAATGLGLALMSVLGWQLLRPLSTRVGGPLRIGWRNVLSRSAGSTLQTVAFGLSLMVLLLLGIVREDLMRDWLNSVPVDAPNRFLINIQSDQVTSLQALLRDKTQQDVPIFPMVRGRLTAINERPVTADHYVDDRAKRLVEREFNLSWSAALPAGNTMTRGALWQPDSAEQFSVEEGLAKTLGIKLGDRLQFRIAAQDITATVSSLRTVQWDSFRVNFFVLAPPGLLDNFPATYITSFYLPAENGTLLTELLRAYPNVTVFDVAAMMDQVRTIIGHVARAVEWVFLFTLAAGLVVFYAALQASWDERLVEAAMLRIFGASRRQLRTALLGEFALLGVMAGGVAALGAAASGYAVAAIVLDSQYIPSPLLLLWGVLGGGIGVSLAGWYSARRIVRQPPQGILRTASL